MIDHGALVPVRPRECVTDPVVEQQTRRESGERIAQVGCRRLKRGLSGGAVGDPSVAGSGAVTLPAVDDASV